MGWLIGLLVLAGLAIAWFAGTYNGLVKLRNRFKNAFAQIDVQLTRRHDLIPNLVEVAKGYMKHERETLDAVISARNAASSELDVAKGKPGDAGVMGALSQAEGKLAGALGRFNMVMEDYPDLKANQNFLDLQAQLEGTENRINVERNRYNEAVNIYDIHTTKFPNKLLAGWFGFEEMPRYQADPGSEKAPEVNFEFD